jgi:hypothetical protein
LKINHAFKLDLGQALMLWSLFESTKLLDYVSRSYPVSAAEVVSMNFGVSALNAKTRSSKMHKCNCRANYLRIILFTKDTAIF